jgi:TFIIF-interacting CTD phosphatase-like protein
VVKDGHWPERAVLVDNSPVSYESTCPDNALPIKPYFGTDPGDNELLALLPVLVALSSLQDVRSLLGLRTDPSRGACSARAKEE